MKYVKADWDEEGHGFRVDAQEYLAVLPTLREMLPGGAWAFVSDAGHYAFASERCVKDLELTNICLPTKTANSADGSGAASLTFSPNRWKHTRGLRIEYADVTHFSIDYARSIDWMESITVLLDEVLPYGAGGGAGITHEIELTDATIRVQCADLTATWEEAVE
ncbi:hypothetical protein AB0E78_25955 [Streptomyces sp. NPDC032198]|uniref:hypothetical protein n=1 Tax=Streptomyces sp. NPDC032198 TaxID=3155127 RepID=UPI0033C6C80A